MEKESEAIEKEEKLAKLAKLIRYHENGLAEHKYTMSISATYLEEQTILALKELQKIRASSNSTAEPKS